MKILASLLLAIELTGLPAYCGTAVSVPSFQGDVLDEFGVLTPEEEESLQLKIQNLRDSSNVWMAVYFAKDLQGTTIEDLAQQVFNTWKLGKQKTNNGLLFIAVVNERKMRFEVGYGLEPILTDAWTKRLQEEILKPRFRNLEYSNGLSEAIDLIAKKAAGQVTELDSVAFLSGTLLDPVWYGYKRIYRKDTVAALMIMILVLSLIYPAFLILKEMILAFIRSRLQTKVILAVVLAAIGFLIQQGYYVVLGPLLFFSFFFFGFSRVFSQSKTYGSRGHSGSFSSSGSHRSGGGSSGSSSGGGSSGGGGSSSSW
jgi:uncharacterized protein